LSGASQTTLNGSSDAVIVSLDNDLNNLIFSTYYGGNGYDNGYSVQVNSTGEIYFCGGTLSTDLPSVANGLVNTAPGGGADGYIAHLSANGNNLLDATYIGTTEYDQCFFLQTDSNDDVFTIGQTNGTYPIQNALYSNPNSGQFIQKLSPDLSTSLMSTTIGRGSGSVEISISAFLVSDCDFIYLSGWGGSLNNNLNYNAHATSSSTLNFPVTADAFQSNTDGQDFYLAVLGPNANTLLYGTYFGGGISSEHVDGGTSRFDKNGNVYQAVCAGCGNNSDFPYTPGAWSAFNNSSCNLGAFKFDLGSITPIVSVPQPYVCLPAAYQFDNNSSGGNEYLWNFGDGTTSNQYAPSHNYSDTGHFEVQLIVMDSLGCLETDTAFLQVDVFALDNAQVQAIDTICVGDSTLLLASGGAYYEWIPNTFLSNPTGQTTYAFPPVSTDYTVITRDSCGTDTAYIRVNVYPDTFSIMPDTLICGGNPVTLFAYGGVDYSWYQDPTIVNPSSQTPTAIAIDTTTYFVDITTASGCVYLESVNINTINNLPNVNLTNDTIVCIGDNIQLLANDADEYIWSPSNLLSSVNDSVATTNLGLNDATIYVNATNVCGNIDDSIFIEVFEIDLNAGNDTTICLGDSALLWAEGMTNYSWTPAASLSTPLSDSTYAFPTDTTIYTVIASHLCGIDTAYVTVSLFNNPHFASEDSVICLGSTIDISASGGVSYAWYPHPTLQNPTSQIATVTPVTNTTYFVDITTPSGCVYTDSTKVTLINHIPVPGLENDTVICHGDNITLHAFDGHSYEWLPTNLVILINDSVVLTNITQTSSITVNVTNACGSTLDTINISVIDVYPTVSSDTSICPNETAYLWATGGTSYSWTPRSSLSHPDSSDTESRPTNTTLYSVDVFNAIGCSKTLTTTVIIFPIPDVQINTNIYADYGDEIYLAGQSNGISYLWTSNDSVYCDTCLSTFAKPEESSYYTLQVTDENGCTNEDSVMVFLDGSLYVPNTFTPNGDGINDFFTIKGKEIKTFQLYIFNRWGELIFESDNMDYQWDGAHNGRQVLIDTYVWKVDYEDYQQNYEKLIGHVNVIR
jgi:gliding motility-associated-like protein